MKTKAKKERASVASQDALFYGRDLDLASMLGLDVYRQWFYRKPQN